mgnify:CR=1 FL=1
MFTFCVLLIIIYTYFHKGLAEQLKATGLKCVLTHYNLDKINRIKCLKYYLCSSIGIPAWEFGNSVKTRSCPRSCKVVSCLEGGQIFSIKPLDRNPGRRKDDKPENLPDDTND